MRGSVVGLFNTASLGLHVGSGLTVGLVGALISVQWSLALSALTVVLIAAVLLARDTGRLGVGTSSPGPPLPD